MIKFQRRNVGCWEICEDVNRNKFDIPILEFENECTLLDYIRKTLPFTQNEDDYKLRINPEGTCVVHWSVLGFIK